MNQSEVAEFVAKLDNVQQEENMGYSFFFVGDDHRLPFVTIAHPGNEYESVSRLDREGVFRINIGVSKETFQSLVGDSISDDLDYSVLDVFLPHPHYAKQHFVCILNPSEQNDEITKQLIVEAYSIAAARYERRASR